jgi:hypothetical protein
MRIKRENDVSGRSVAKAPRFIRPWSPLSRWFNWQHALIVVRPRTLITWHRKGFRHLPNERVCGTGVA